MLCSHQPYGLYYAKRPSHLGIVHQQDEIFQCKEFGLVAAYQ